MKPIYIVSSKNRKKNYHESEFIQNIFPIYRELENNLIKAVNLSMYYGSIKNDAVLQEKSRKLLMHAQACIRLFTKIWQLN